MSASAHLGIDLGTTNSAAAVFDGVTWFIWFRTLMVVWSRHESTAWQVACDTVNFAGAVILSFPSGVLRAVLVPLGMKRFAYHYANALRPFEGRREPQACAAFYALLAVSRRPLAEIDERIEWSRLHLAMLDAQQRFGASIDAVLFDITYASLTDRVCLLHQDPLCRTLANDQWLRLIPLAQAVSDLEAVKLLRSNAALGI